MSGIYTITLQNCAFFARHGVHDEEEFLGQRFFVDAELDVAAGEALVTDSIDGTVNYGVAFTVIEEIVTGKRRYLIEALALDVAKGLCEKFPQIKRVKVTVRKPNAPVPGVLDYVQVSIEHFA
ncbi:dihydroneopterin aldolase [Rhizobium tumorigenes]|uniref:7,8-dihydroneopterin aldolase n=1 Tax=Rhizobium tumorigenes TaxID=2041385 RepID=A0AAF1KGR2_9HYPH|nr:dihydroneopterin aldolase [Rhizobium tumorigenes]WFR96981.1 dihydroneopterin aldolase [Rhizobium tumorigenes]WFS02538.1 dihydroneopterin aldolase [Rhizobium tumorigenes]